MVAVVRQQDDLPIQINDRQFDLCVHAYYKLHVMVERWFYKEGLGFVSLKLKVVAKCGDPKLLTNAMKSYVWAKDLNIRDCALKGSESFGCTKRKLDLPPGARL